MKKKTVITFASKLNPVVGADFDKYLAIASANNFGKYIPKNIDFNKKIDFLGFAGEAFFGNRLNRNGHGVKAKEAVELAELIPYSFINVDHSRKNCVGVITTATFTEYGTGKEITKEEALKMTSPFAVVVGGVIWKTTNPTLAAAIEESSDDNKFFLSWEVAFDEYELIKIEGKKYNFEDGEFISDDSEIEKIEEEQEKNKNAGHIKYGMVATGGVVPLGCGIVETPAATVQPLAFEGANVTLKLTDDELEAEILSIARENQNKSSQNEQTIVKEIRKIMKITSLQDITNEALEKKEITASAISDFIEQQIKQESEKWATEKTLKDSEVSASKETNKKLEEELNTVKSELASLQKERKEAVAAEKFNQRMSHLDDVYVLDADSRKVVASQIKDLSDEDYTKFETSFAVLMKDKTKEAVAKLEAEKEELIKKESSKNKTEVAASETVTQTVETVIDNASKEKQTVPNTSSPTLTLKERLAKSFAFNKENWTVSFDRRRKI
jgi:hypothetical protein